MEIIVTAAEMRAAEQRAERAGTSTRELMQNAGHAAAQVIGEAVTRGGAKARIVILCGPGNNGGDGVVAAQRLHEQGYAVSVYSWHRADETPETPPRLAVVRHEEDSGLTALRRLLDESSVVVDALLGTGRSRPIEGDLAAILDYARAAAAGRAVVALDLPSGLDADSGAADPHTIPATVTITFGLCKRGLLLGEGPDVAGHIVTVDIGLPADAGADVPFWSVAEEDVRQRIPRRSRHANKYSAGAVMVVGGSRRFTGAPQLATLGAARGGAGLVTLATGASTHPILANHLTEPTFLVLQDDQDGVLDPDPAAEAIREAAGRYKALLIGPGLAQGDKTVRLVETLLCDEGLPDGLPIVVDAEGLNALAKVERWPERARHPLILTPHAGEMARLCGTQSSEIEPRRADVALERARAWKVVVVLKGNPTVTASPEDSAGSAAINTTGGPNLASGGTGDVLGGVIAALVAQGAPLFDAALSGVYLHGRAGDLLMRQHGDRGTLAGDLLPVLPTVIKNVLEGTQE